MVHKYFPVLYRNVSYFSYNSFIPLNTHGYFRRINTHQCNLITECNKLKLPFKFTALMLSSTFPTLAYLNMLFIFELTCTALQAFSKRINSMLSKTICHEIHESKENLGSFGQFLYKEHHGTISAGTSEILIERNIFFQPATMISSENLFSIVTH